ncbi:right-handed parallel beta-helix repeat-containing protein [Vibrio sp. LaRot3]|uniref:right-handed parallel beta-helix repeat-containing protein n=1 Tax=Vibrio sp. LaRot3 TaxID=2998829 RepID=UPI0022CE2A32|nr:right-handed parallel beta-helix repeat-containing protein [Vibrio sp. LaRot3]MDA0147872.1 right-handed parallel beta-helix repeat-containing protein [Vibrio sp. LaRot3]
MKIRLLLIGCSLLSSWSAFAATVKGTIFEDYNFGGEARQYASNLGMAKLNRMSITVRLTNVDYPQYYYEQETYGSGQYRFNGIPAGYRYRISLPNARPMGSDKDGQLYSERGDCYDCLPVQVYPYLSKDFGYEFDVVGGQSTRDIGINYSSVINGNDSGAGSLRQFIINSYSLRGTRSSQITKSVMRQEFHTEGVDNAIFAMPQKDVIINLNSKLNIGYPNSGMRDTHIAVLDTQETYSLANSVTINSSNNFSHPNDTGRVFDVYRSSNIKLARLYLNSTGDNSSSNANAITVQDVSSDIHIEGNIISGSSDDAIEVNDSRDIVILSNRIHDIEDDAIQVYNISSSSGNSITIDNNIIERVGDDGIKLYWTNSSVIKNNRLNQINGIGLSVENSDRFTATYNSFSYIGGNALSMYTSGDNVFSDNLVDRSYISASDKDSAAAIYFEHNAHDSQFFRNTFSHTGLNNDVEPPASVFRFASDNSDRNYVVNNVYQNNAGMLIDIVKGRVGVKDSNDGKYGGPNDGVDHPIITDIEQVGNDLVIYGYTGIQGSDENNRNGKIDAQMVEFYNTQLDANDDIVSAQSLGMCYTETHWEHWQYRNFKCTLANAASPNINAISAIAVRHKITGGIGIGDPLNPKPTDNKSSVSEFGPAFDYVGNRSFDYGDAPNQDLQTGWENARFKVTKADDGARHVVAADMCLRPFGTNSCTYHIDEEKDATPSRYASSDEGDDGVWINPYKDELSQSSLSTLITGYLDENGDEQAVDNHILINASRAGYISIWLDKNQDGSWQDFERDKQPVLEKIVDRYRVNAGSNVIDGINLSAYDVHGESWLRVRFSTSASAIEHSYGTAPDGEVEDYRVWIAAPSLQTAGCAAGLQNGSFEHYYTENGNNGWDTPESSVAGWSVQQLDPTLIPSGMPYEERQQRRNHIEFNDHYYYLRQAPLDGSSNVAELNVYHPTMLYQDIVTKPGDEISWSFDYSNRTKPNSHYNDQMSLLFGSPSSSLVETKVITGKDAWQRYEGVYTVPAGQYVTRIAFRSNLPVSGSAGNILDNAQFGCHVGYDYGDLPTQYNNEQNTRYRVSPNLYVGEQMPDTETSASPSLYARGDDTTEFNDERTFDTPVIIKKQNDFTIHNITVFNATKKNAHLNAWLDIDRNGVMDSNEKAKQVIVKPMSSAQKISLEWKNIRDSRWTSDDQSYLRISLVQDGYGEVEDHLVYLTNDDLMPLPGRCDGFVQVKAPQTSGQTQYQYSKWVANGGQLAIEDINPALSTKEIKVVGLSQKDGLTYGVGSDEDYGCQSLNGSRCEVHLFVADQSRSPAAEFTHLVPLRAANNNAYILDKNGNRFSFAKDEVLDTRKYSDNYTRRLLKANSGDVSIDGRYMILGRGSWQTLVRVDLATGAFDTIQLQMSRGQNVPWSADFAFNPNQPDSPYVYGLSRDLKKLYRIAIADVSSSEPAGSFTELNLALKLNSDSTNANPDWPQADSRGRLGAGGVGVNKGGVIFAMTNGGYHDLDQDGQLEFSETSRPTTALYSVDIAKQEIRFEMVGVDGSTMSNDAGGCAIHADYGDAPKKLELQSDPARHLGSSSAIKLGEHWSADLGPGHDNEAKSDLSDDGVEIIDPTTSRVINLSSEPLIPLKRYQLRLDKRGGGIASAWVNWGEEGKTSWIPITIADGLEVPLANGGRGYLRVRYASSKVTSPFGVAENGEVEDFSFEIGNPVKGIDVKAPSSSLLTCEVAEYRVSLDVEGDQLSQDVDVDVWFDQPPAGCWYSLAPFGRGDAINKTSCSTQQTVTFAKDGSLSKTIYVATDSELKPVTLHAEATDIGSDSDFASFSKEGFVITEVTPNGLYKAGEEFAIRLERKVALEDVSRCSVDPDYQGDKEFTFSSGKGSEQHLGKLMVDGKELTSSDNKRVLSFSNGVSGSFPLNYFESGTLDLYAETHPEEGHVKTAGTSFIVHPYALTVTRNYTSANPTVQSQTTNTPFTTAGTPFTVEVAAVASNGQVTQNFNGQLIADAGNSRAATTGFSRKVTSPSDQPRDATDLIETSALNRQFSQGLLSNRFEYRNVGSLATRWKVDSYKNVTGLASFLDTDITHRNIDNHRQVGYFYPSHFALSRAYSADWKHEDQPWTYYGKPDVLVGATLTAKAIGGQTLSFYDGDIMQAGDYPQLAATSLEYVNAPTCNTQLLHHQGTAIDFDQTWSGGDWQLQNDTYAFYRDPSCRSEISNIAVQMKVPVSVPNATIPIFELGSGEDLSGGAIPLGDEMSVRFGRLSIDNTAGPIQQTLPMGLKLEYWSGNNRFEVNTWDSESNLTEGGIGVINKQAVTTQAAKQGDKAPVISTESFGMNEVKDGQSLTTIEGSDPGYATVPFKFANDSEQWLGYCWKIDDNAQTIDIPSDCKSADSFTQPPEALATFGVSAGSNNVIYFMERYQ